MSKDNVQMTLPEELKDALGLIQAPKVNSARWYGYGIKNYSGPIGDRLSVMTGLYDGKLIIEVHFKRRFAMVWSASIKLGDVPDCLTLVPNAAAESVTLNIDHLNAIKSFLKKETTAQVYWLSLKDDLSQLTNLA